MPVRLTVALTLPLPEAETFRVPVFGPLMVGLKPTSSVQASPIGIWVPLMPLVVLGQVPVLSAKKALLLMMGKPLPETCQIVAAGVLDVECEVAVRGVDCADESGRGEDE